MNLIEVCHFALQRTNLPETKRIYKFDKLPEVLFESRADVILVSGIDIVFTCLAPVSDEPVMLDLDKLASPLIEEPSPNTWTLYDL